MSNCEKEDTYIYECSEVSTIAINYENKFRALYLFGKVASSYLSDTISSLIERM